MRGLRVERQNGYCNEYCNESECVVSSAGGTQYRAQSYPMQRPNPVRTIQPPLHYRHKNRVNTIAHTTAHTGTSTGKAPALLCRTHTEFLQSVEGFNSCPCVSQRDLKFVKRYLFPPIPQCLPASFLHGKKLAHPRLQVSNSKF
jgi:hypothetical protein